MESPSFEDVLRLRTPLRSILKNESLANRELLLISLKMRSRDINLDFEGLGGAAGLSDSFVDEETRGKGFLCIPAGLLDQRRANVVLTFKTSDPSINSLRIVDILYWKGAHVETFQFSLGYIISHSSNTWECVYKIPRALKKIQKELVTSPNDLEMDSFLFVNNELTNHNKVYFSFTND